MSFVLISNSQNKSSYAATEEGSLSVDIREQEIELRVQQELDRLRHTIFAEAQSAADESARAALKPLEQQLQNALSALLEASTELTSPLAQKEKYLADLVLDIAFRLSSHIVGVHVTQDQMPLLNLVTKLLDEISADGPLQKNITVHLSPLDLPFIKSNLLESNVNFIEDSSVEPGGALLECPSDTEDFLDRTVWDAQLKSRFDILRQALLPTLQASM